MAGEKTEEATPKRLEKSREKGEVFQSRDLTGAVLLACATAVIAGQIDEVGITYPAMARTIFAAAGSGNISNNALLTLFGTAVLEGAKSLVPLLGVVFLASLVMPFLQVGPLLSFSPLMPKFSKLDPIKGIKNKLFSLNAYIELLKTTVKLIVIAVIFWKTIMADMRNVLLLSTQEPTISAGVALSIGGHALTRTVVVFFAFGALDYMYQRWQYHKNMRMSKEEIKQEYKESEGDPHHKAHRKRAHEELSSESMMEHARKADVMVTNPEHLACALRYDPNEEGAPRLLAKGRDYVAARLREIAREEDIPITRDISLAHALYALELDREIPEELFDAAAEVLKWVEAVLKAEGEVAPWLLPPKEKEEK